jgi:hypothetical protein
MVKTKTLGKILSRFRPAIYLGIKLETGEKIVAITDVPDGENQIHVVRTVRRVPTASAWDLDMIKKIKGVPWNPSSQGGLPGPAVAADWTQPPVAVVPPPERIGVFKRMKLLPSDFDAHGHTPGCKGCRLMMIPGASSAAHSEECRKRMTEAILNSGPAGRARVEQSDQRINSRIGEVLQQQDRDAGPSQQAAAAARPPQFVVGGPLNGTPQPRGGPSGDVEMDIRSLIEMKNLEEFKRAAELSPMPVPEDPALVSGLDEAEWYDWDSYRDTVTGAALQTSLVRAAQKEELDYMAKLNVWTRFEDMASARAEIARRGKQVDAVIASKWVITNKADESAPDIRCRLVGTEVAYGKTANAEAAFFAATPPLEATKALLAAASADRRAGLMLIDVRKAHLNGTCRRGVVIKLPRECGGGFGVLNKIIYGCRDAANGWDLEIKDKMMKYGLKQGLSNPCCWTGKGLKVVVHGDDITCLGHQQSLLSFRRYLESCW